MENGLKWEKQPSGWEWRKRAETYRAEICNISGGVRGKPYEWKVMPWPRPQTGMWLAIGKGYCAKLAEAKAEADAVIARLTAPAKEEL